MARKAKSKAAVISADEVFKKMQRAAFSVDFLQNPESALMSYKLVDETPGQEGRELNEKALEAYNALFVELVEKKTTERIGLTIEQLRHPEMLTPEQRKTAKLTSVIIRDEIETERRQSYLQSYFYSALTMLEAFKIKSYASDEEAAIKEVMAIYFLTLHDMEPTAPGALTDEQAAELAALMRSLDDYFSEADSEGNESSEGSGVFEILHEFIKSNTPGGAKKTVIEILQTLKTEKHIMPNHSIMNYLASDYAIINDGDGVDVPVNNKKGLSSYIMASNTTLKDSKGELIRDKLTEHERQVSDGIMSIFEDASSKNLPAIFTVDMAFRAMPGGGEKANPKEREKIVQAIEKLRALHIEIDVTDEFRERKLIPPEATQTFDDYYLSVTRVTRRTKDGGKIVQAYLIRSEPIVLTISKATSQYITVKSDTLDIKRINKDGEITSESVSMTAERRAIVGYLMRRIKIIQNDNENAKKLKRRNDCRNKKNPDKYPLKPLEAFRAIKSNVILFSSIYADVDISEPSRDKALDIRKFCYQALDFWTKRGDIRGYKEQRKGRTITGIILTL